jgi:hypothetical protein
VAGSFPSDITLVNWPQIDYWLGPVIGVSEEEKQKTLAGRAGSESQLRALDSNRSSPPRRRTGLSRHQAARRHHRHQERPGEIRLHPRKPPHQSRIHRLGTARRIAIRPNGAEKFADSVGIGCYRIDLHPSTGGQNYIDVGSWPFQIPLGSLIPQRVENLLPAVQKPGRDAHHQWLLSPAPVEWNIGESAGALAAHCLQNNLTPRGVRNNENQLKDFQRVLKAQGVELDWPTIYSV